MLESKARAYLEETARKFITLIPQSRLVVGLSGGADSTLVLLLACKMRKLNPKYHVVAVHCIHGLDADDPIWYEHCKELCKKVNADEFITPKLNIVYGNGRSPEEVSRAERYRALLENLQDGVLMLGHQADDEVENFLLSLKRGSGPEGLSGMSEIKTDRRGTIVRPLLNLHKREIEEIIKALGFDFVYDISNSYLKFERNFMRLKVLPLLRERFKGIDGAILRSSHLCALEHDLASRYIKPLYEKALTQFHGTCALDLREIDLEDESAAIFILRSFLKDAMSFNPEYACVLEALKFAHATHDNFAKLKLEGNLHLRRYLDYLLVVPDFVPPTLGVYPLKIGEILVLGDFEYSLEKCSIKYEAFPVTEDGVLLDFSYKGSMKLKPLSRNLSREIKKLFGEYKVPVWERFFMCLVKTKDNEDLALGNLFSTKKACLNGYCLKIVFKEKV